jgi:hypothetical protein
LVRRRHNTTVRPAGIAGEPFATRPQRAESTVFYYRQFVIDSGK